VVLSMLASTRMSVLAGRIRGGGDGGGGGEG
jgi:hypothetical protein